MAKKIGDITILRYPSGKIQISQYFEGFDTGLILICTGDLKEVAAELTRLAEKKIE